MHVQPSVGGCVIAPPHPPEYGQGMLRVYSCCRQEQGSSSGCVLADVRAPVTGVQTSVTPPLSPPQMHVTAGSQPPRDTGYVSTLPGPSPSHQVYSLDCEMCYTTVGLQLTKVSVIDMTLEPVYEKVVKPRLPIVDYNTRYWSHTCCLATVLIRS